MTGSGLIASGLVLHTPGLNVVNWHDDPRLRLKMGEDGTLRPRGEPINAVVVHSTRGAPDNDDPRPQVLHVGVGPSSRAGVEIVDDWNHDHRCAGAHFVIDFDGTVYQLADVDLEETYNATTVNARVIGVELKQGRDCEFYGGQMSAWGELADWLCLYREVPRYIPDRYRGPLVRLSSGDHDYRGVFGHRDQTSTRGFGDPGDFAFAELGNRGFAPVNILAREDQERTREIQRALGFAAGDVDGVYGPQTFAALRGRGYAGGQWTLPPAT